MASYEFSYPSKLRSESRMLSDMLLTLEKHSISDFVKRKFLVSVSEAFTNALLHANELNPQKQVKILIRVNKTEISADIIDQGRDGLEKISKKRPATAFDEGGRGLDIISHYADEVRIEEMPEGGLKIFIRFTLDMVEKIKK
jgi:anti-sigma regulatory factor (Ser/Thr protein kinase)